MANYVPHYKKKRLALECKEAALRRLISKVASEQKLLAMAEQVLVARTRVVRSDVAKSKEGLIDATVLAKAAAAITAIEATSPEEILAEFGVRL